MALYNKYKPLKLSQVFGIYMDIFKAICDHPKAGNAILLTGPPGTGKTLLAHIYGRYINCLSDGDEEEKPCGKCTNCQMADDEISETSATLQNSVENIRALNEASDYLPMQLKYKIYIIDEVHTLSSSAIDALLLKLHNPPEHAKFIFATTQPENLPLKFTSRCIEFKLFRLNENDILKIITNICHGENKNIDERILHLITKESEGSARKAISFLESIIQYENIDLETAKKYFKILSIDTCIKIFEYCINNQVSKAIEIWNDLYDSGYGEKACLHKMLQVINNLYLCKVNMLFENKTPYEDLLNKYDINDSLLANVWDTLNRALTYLYQIKGPAISIPSVLIQIGIAKDLMLFPNEIDLISKTTADRLADTVNFNKFSNTVKSSVFYKKTPFVKV